MTLCKVKWCILLWSSYKDRIAVPTACALKVLLSATLIITGGCLQYTDVSKAKSLTQWILAPESITQYLDRCLQGLRDLGMLTLGRDMHRAHLGEGSASIIIRVHLHNTILLSRVTSVDVTFVHLSRHQNQWSSLYHVECLWYDS